TDQSNINSGTFNSLWNFDDGTNSPNVNPTHVFASDDTFMVKLILTSNLNCSDSATKSAYVFPLPEPDFTINDSTQCFEYNNFVFTNTSSIKWGTLSNYYWDFDDGGNSSSVNVNHSYITQDDTFNVMLSATSALGCIDTNYKTVYVLPMPVADFSIWDSSQCFENNAFGFQNQSTISSGTLSALWNFDDGTYSTTTNPVHSFLYADTFAVQLTAISAFNCRDSIIKNTYIHVHPQPNAAFTINDSAQCLNSNNFVFTNNTTITADTFSQTWYFDDGDTSSSFDVNHIYGYPDTFVIKLMVISDFFCKDSALKTSIIYPNPVIDFAINDSSQCLFGNSFVFSDSSSISSGTYNQVWSFGDGNTDSSINSTHSYLSPDTFQVKLAGYSSLGCDDSISKNVYVHPMPNADFSINDSTQSFQDNNFIFTSTSTISSGAISYYWTFGDGNSSTLQNPVHVYSTDDTFTVKLVISSTANACLDSISKTVYVFPTPSVEFAINDSAQCYNENTFVFTNNTTINWGNISFYWFFGDGDTSTLTNPSHIYNSDDTFSVKLLAISETGAKDSLTKVLIVFPSPVTAFDISDSQQCFNGNSFVFTNNSTINTGTQTYSWNFGDASTSNTTSPVHTYATDDTFTVFLIANSNLNCADTLSKTTYVFPSPNSTFSINDSQQCFNENHFVLTNNSTINTGSQT
ncbi:MAG: PKD domain-containing protein, partial [Bacteroidota bacterium]|nr:PKD domain-containing protein [Bacteroidota bacterium]